MGKEHFLPRVPKEVAELFSAKKKVTRKDAKKLNPLMKFWEKKIKNAMALGIYIGGFVSIAVFIIYTWM